MRNQLRRSALAVAVAVAGPIAVATAEVIIDANFDQPGAKLTDAPSPVGKVSCWTGPEGKVLGQATLAANGDGQAMTLSNNAHPASIAPVIEIDWRETSAANTSEPLTIAYSFMVPVDGEYLSTHFFGDGWDNAAVVLIFENGKIQLQYGERAARLDVGNYAVNKWVDVRVTLDGERKAATLYLDGKKAANAVPWQTNAKPVAHVSVIANQRPVSRDGVEMLRIDNVRVETGAVATTRPSDS